MATSKIKQFLLPNYKGHIAAGANTPQTIELTRGTYMFVFGSRPRPNSNGIFLVCVRNGNDDAATITTIGGNLSEISLTDEGNGIAPNSRIIKVTKTAAGTASGTVFYMGNTD